MTLDLMFLAKGRVEYTRESVAALIKNTDWALVRRLVIYTDGQPNHETFRTWIDPIRLHGKIKEGEVSFASLGGPVNIMLDYLKRSDVADVFAKIDNDVIVPPGWLNQCVAVMEAHEELDLLGIEPPASRTRAPWRADVPLAPEIAMMNQRITAACSDWRNAGSLIKPPMGYARCDAVGGIGLFRPRAWKERGWMSQHSTYGGFTDWQLSHKQRDVVKGWIVPPIALFLLDRLPFDPWLSLGRRYQAEGLQRPWTIYEQAAAAKLSDWWFASRRSVV